MHIMNADIKEYFEALDRLKNGTPQVLPVGSVINNDNVSLEAGRKRGSIKKGREVFAALISEIEDAKLVQLKLKKKNDPSLIADLQRQVNHFKFLYEQAVARELSLVAELYELKYGKKKNLTIVK